LAYLVLVRQPIPEHEPAAAGAHAHA